MKMNILKVLAFLQLVTLIAPIVITAGEQFLFPGDSGAGMVMLFVLPASIALSAVLGGIESFARLRGY